MKERPKSIIVIKYFIKIQFFMMKKPRYKKGGRKKIQYYDSRDAYLVKQIPIENATLEEILLKIYPNTKHIYDFRDGSRGLFGLYDVTPKMKELLCEKFNIEIDTEQFDCMLAEGYETDSNITILRDINNNMYYF